MVKSFSVLLVVLGIASTTLIDKFSFYKAFQSNSQEKIESKLSGLAKVRQSNSRDAYIGALTMKHSQFEATSKEKIAVFKEGRNLLETAIKKDPKNAEYRFLRFAIQENAPKILKYKMNMEEDKNMIISNYKSLDPTLRKIIKEYAKQSANLPSERLK